MISEYEKGAIPKTDKINRLATALNVQANHIMELIKTDSSELEFKGVPYTQPPRPELEKEKNIAGIRPQDYSYGASPLREIGTHHWIEMIEEQTGRVVFRIQITVFAGETLRFTTRAPEGPSDDAK